MAHANKSDSIRYFRSYYATRRARVLQALGSKCKKCGFSDERALQIDHVNGGGSKERRTKHGITAWLNQVYQHIISGGEEYQLLCANCNWIKRHENNENRPKVYAKI